MEVQQGTRNNNNNHRCPSLSHSHRTNQDFLIGGTQKNRISGRKIKASSLLHRRKLMKKMKATLKYGDQSLYTSRQFAEGSNKYEEFFCYNENDDDDVCNGNSEDDSTVASESCLPFVQPKPDPSCVFQDISINVTDFLLERQFGNTRIPLNLQSRISDKNFQSVSDFPIKHLLTNGILQEKPIKIENLNKVFCSQWLSDRQVIFGTKCNKLMVLDVQTKHMTQIPSLAPSVRSQPPDQQCGIHTIQLNPSKSMIATGGRNPNDIAIYQLPTLDPLYVGEAHQDWVFGTTWLDDQFLVSGSRDTSLALWKIPEPEVFDLEEMNHRRNNKSSVSTPFRPSSSSVSDSTSSASSSSIGIDDLHNMDVPSYKYINAVSVKQCKSAQKVRDIVFNRHLQELVCVSLNGYVHVWAADRFVQKFSRKLPFCLENVCMAVHEDYGLYAVGSKSHTTLMDARTIQCVKKIASKYSGYGIRSTSFFSSLLSIGTGQGTIMFYDLRAGKYLESNINSARSATLKSSSGWTYPDEEILMDVYRQKYTPAIYTHCIDNAGVRIFAAGGPLPITLCGNYIGLWH